MHDDIYMQEWSSHHHVISQGIDRLLGRLFSARRNVGKSIGSAYAGHAGNGARTTLPTRAALLSGLASVVLTAIVFTAGIATVTDARPVMAGPVENGTFLVELA